MGEGETIVAVLGILCGTGITITFINMLRAAVTRGASKTQDTLVNEIKGLREEMSQLRRENHDVILSFDTSINRMDKRLEYLETRGQLPAGESEQRVVSRLG
jgi:hypothetical protein